MNETKVMKLFLLFSGAAHDADWHELTDEAVTITRASLRENADETDIRLCYYAAALANLRYRQILAARGAVSPTYAGTVPNNSRNDSSPCAFAQQLLTQYRNDCADLLNPKADALLLRTGGKENAHECSDCR